MEVKKKGSDITFRLIVDVNPPGRSLPDGVLVGMLKGKCEDLEQENKELRSEINRLRQVIGEC